MYCQNKTIQDLRSPCKIWTNSENEDFAQSDGQVFLVLSLYERPVLWSCHDSTSQSAH